MKLKLILIIPFFTISIVNAQEKIISDTTGIDFLIRRLELLEERVLKQEQEDELKRLMDEANKLSEKKAAPELDITKKFQSGERLQQKLNPNFSVLGDNYAAITTGNNSFNREPSNYTHGYSGIYLRSLELSMEASLDPFTRGKAFLDINDRGINIEEAYMELINLPLNMSLKAGVFFPEFGLLNRYHTHALPQFNRPQVCVNYFDPDGFNGTGMAAAFLLPPLLFSDASSLNFAVISGNSDNNSFPDISSRNFLYVGHLKNYYNISDASYFEYTLSSVTGKNGTYNGNYSWISSLGLHYKWQPPSKAKYKSSEWMAELYYGKRESIAGLEKSKGFYVLSHNKVSTRWWFGARAGYSEMPFDASQYIWDYSVNLDFWQSEFVFFRLQYQYNNRDINFILNNPVYYPSDHAIILQVSWAMGPHKHEAY